MLCAGPHSWGENVRYACTDVTRCEPIRAFASLESKHDTVCSLSALFLSAPVQRQREHTLLQACGAFQHLVFVHSDSKCHISSCFMDPVTRTLTIAVWLRFVLAD